MQKGDIAKLKLLLAGISARMTKNRDYFIRAVCTFTSGKKKFDAEAFARRAKLGASFSGQYLAHGCRCILCIFCF